MCARPCSRRALASLVTGFALALVLAVSACGGVDPETPTDSPSAGASSGTASATPSTRPGEPGSPVASPTVPADGVGLPQLGFTHGPAGFSIPRGAVFVTAVDQPNVVTLVLSAPSPADLAAYLRRTLPTIGFTITADDPAVETLAFTGRGWDGTFTASAGSTAIVLDAT